MSAPDEFSGEGGFARPGEAGEECGAAGHAEGAGVEREETATLMQQDSQDDVEQEEADLCVARSRRAVDRHVGPVLHQVARNPPNVEQKLARSGLMEDARRPRRFERRWDGAPAHDHIRSRLVRRQFRQDERAGENQPARAIDETAQ